MKVIGNFVLLVATLATQAPTTSTVRLGGIRLIPGYEHEVLKGIDSLVGRIHKREGLEILYDIGGMAGNITRQVPPEKRKWTKETLVEGRNAIIMLSDDNRLFVTFLQTDTAPSANFFATVKSQEDVADMLLMVLGYPGKR